jgi:hypothetical protein
MESPKIAGDLAPAMSWANAIGWRYGYFTLSVLAFINCKNVELMSVAVSAKLQKKRAASGKHPLVSWRVIALESTARALREAGADPRKIGIGRALGRVRGHIKHYEAGRGLFGKHHGSWLWHDTAKGDVSKGVVVKDYATSKAAAARLRKSPPSRAELDRRAAAIVEMKGDATPKATEGEAVTDSDAIRHQTFFTTCPDWGDAAG